MVALSVASKPLALPVTPDLPVSVPASSVITWTGRPAPPTWWTTGSSTR